MTNRSLEEMVTEIAAERLWSQGEVLIMAFEFMESRQLESFFLRWLIDEADEQDKQLIHDEQAADYIEMDNENFLADQADQDFMLNYEPDEP
jgi:hypothetical protein